MQRRDALKTMAALSLGAVAGCSSGKPSGKRRIAVMPKGTSHDFWKSVHFGARKDTSEDGVENIWQGTLDETDKEGQIKFVDNFISRKVDGIILAPIDRDAFVPVVERAKRRGVPTVVFDSGLSDLSQVVSYVATNNLKGGQMAAEHMVKLLGDEGGGVIMLRYQAGSESTEQREQGFRETLKKYDNVELLSESQQVNSKADEARKIAGGILRRFATDVKGVFTVCEPNNKGMLLALRDEKLATGERMAGKVRFVAFDSDPQVLQGLQGGEVHGVVLQDPVNMGYRAVKTMVSHLDGQSVPDRIETGEYLATPENMKEAKYRDLLEPKQHEG